jgi:hypothetical protein
MGLEEREDRQIELVRSLRTATIELGRRRQGASVLPIASPLPPTAKLDRLTIKVDRPQLSTEDIRRLQAAQRAAAKARE